MQKEGPVSPKNIGRGRRVSIVSLEVLHQDKNSSRDDAMKNIR